jgi:hypothetical protein
MGGRVKINLRPDPAYHSTGDVYLTASDSEEGKVHITVLSEQGAICSCNGFQYNNYCWHVRKVLEVGRIVDNGQGT